MKMSCSDSHRFKRCFKSFTLQRRTLVNQTSEWSGSKGDAR